MAAVPAHSLSPGKKVPARSEELKASGTAAEGGWAPALETRMAASRPRPPPTHLHQGGPHGERVAGGSGRQGRWRAAFRRATEIGEAEGVTGGLCTGCRG